MPRAEALRTAILSRSLEPARLIKALSLSNAPQPVRDATGKVVLGADGKVEMGPSPRQKELDAIRSEFPGLGAELDALIAANDRYLEKRT